MRICPACGSPRLSDDWTCLECGHRPAEIDGVLAFAQDQASDNPGFQESFFADLAELEGSNFWFRARNELIVWAMRTYVPECRRFLEIGCGTGFVLSAIRSTYPDAELVGSEIFSAGLGFAASRVPTAAFYQMDARSIPFRDHFDAIGAFDVLEHIVDDAAVIAEVRRALRPGGTFVLSVPQHPALWSPQDEHAFHIRRYTAGGIRGRLEAGGFEIVRMTSFVSLLLPLMVASRARMRIRPSKHPFDAMDELRVSPMANRAMRPVMSVERALIRLGVSFPAGGSLLVVARKRADGEKVA